MFKKLSSLGQDWSHDPAAMPMSLKFTIFWIMAFGQFMALFDIQIVSASLSDVQAGLAAGPDEVSWVQTAYLMAELVMIPLSGYLNRAVSTRWLFSMSAALFTLSSLLCGMAWNIETMILFRAVQGFTGGAMVPVVLSFGFRIFSGKQLAIIPAILGAVGVIAPTLGPTVGGLITQALDWRWLFFVNIVPGVVVTVLSVAIIRVDKPDWKMLGQIDWSHFFSMAIALGGLEYVLEEGPRKDWFGDPVIAVVGWAALVSFALFMERAFFSPNPVVRLQSFRKPVFAFACVFSFVVGFGMYSSIYLVPVYLARVRGYDSLQIGTTVFVVGIAQLASTFIVSKLVEAIDVRWIITAGLSLFSWSLWLTSSMSSSWGFWELAFPQAVRGLSLMLCIVPSIRMALGSVPPSELPFASGLINLMRNAGGAVGIAIVNTLLQDHTRIATLRLGEALSHSGGAFGAALGQVAGRLGEVAPDPAEALRLAQAMLARVAGRESLTIAFDDAFRLMSWMFMLALLMVPFCRPSNHAAPPPSSAAH